MPSSKPSTRMWVARHPANTLRLLDEQMRARVFPSRKLLQPNQADSLPKLKCGRLPARTLRLWRDSSPRHDNAPRTRSAAHTESSPVEQFESKDDDRAESGKWYQANQFAQVNHGEKTHWVDR